MPNKEIDLSYINPKQRQFFLAENKYVAYGGARGGGKSWAVRKKAIILAMGFDGIRILIMRRTFQELEANHIRELQKELNGIAKYTDNKKIFLFQNGSIIKLGYCSNENDVNQYQGQEYDVIFMDEATLFSEYQYQTITACLRGTNDFPKRMYLTCNPGGVGHTWVKRLFVERKYQGNEKPDDYFFIPATVYDNTVLMAKNPDYVTQLENQPPGLREAWLLGNWDIMAGQYFSEFNRDAHVIDPIEIEPHWKIYRAIDYGLDCFACLWIAVDEYGKYYVFREYAEPEKIISDGCAEIKDICPEKIEMTLAPPDIWGRSQESGRSRADLFRENGVPLVRSDSRRESGWLNVKELLRHERLYIFRNCTGLIACITELQRDGRNPNDCMTEPHDITHLPDALRYFCAYWVNTPSAPKQEKSEPDYLFDMKSKMLKSKKIKRSYY